MIKAFDIFFILLAFAIFSWGIYRRARLWSIGKEENRSSNMWARIKSFLVEGIIHRRILKDPYPGTIHLFIFLGFLVPLIIIILTQLTFTLSVLLARLVSVGLDTIGLAAVAFILLAMYRRYISRPSRLDNKADDFISLALFILILLTGFTLEGLRLSVIGKDSHAWAPAGQALAAFFNLTGLAGHTKSVLAMVVFRIHLFLVLATIAYIPYSKLFHIISSSMNMIHRSLEPKGVLSHMDLEDEEAESFGVAKIEEFTWKQLMDLDACTRCGRCQDHCPAHLTEKPLSPKKVITDLKEHLHTRGAQILEAKAKKKEVEEVPSLVGSTIEEDALWTCTTCRSCMEHCPVFIEHVDKIIDMRRYQVLMESKFPEELTQAFKGLETNSNPWGLGFNTRADWISELDVPILSEIEDKEIDYLFFVGCIRSYDDRNKKVAIAMARILKHLGTKFAILGMEEGCCGDPARRVGNEYLYQILAQTNIETFNRFKIKRILTTCPHCYNTFKNEYPQLGFNCTVIHSAVFLQENIRNGRLTLEHSIPKRIAYHDPCYLGRYSGIYEPPRKVLKSIPSLDIREMKHSRIDALCCGAGGGWMWMDEKIGKRINIHRLEDTLTADPEWIATACPFCVTMFDDAIKDKSLEEKLKIWDIVELVEMAIFGAEKKPAPSVESAK
ncbi:MAG: 4Fe-4S dicluster domain-containing protein [Candidatus Aminicenantes bacterium]|nr:MAG: 4Fe-4S dicluster domain-containing protein [Candidatus Aminicenantes bacterium]